MILTFEYKYKIGERVHYCLPDGDVGIIIDASYSLRNKTIRYLVSFDYSELDTVWCYEEELSVNKCFN